jgi:hypothetical protein
VAAARKRAGGFVGVCSHVRFLSRCHAKCGREARLTVTWLPPPRNVFGRNTSKLTWQIVEKGAIQSSGRMLAALLGRLASA